MIGKAAFCLEEYEQSLAAYTSATSIEPTNAQAWQGMSELHSKTQNWTSLSAVLESLVAIALTDQGLQNKIHGLRIKLADAYLQLGTKEALIQSEAICRSLVAGIYSNGINFYPDHQALPR